MTLNYIHGNALVELFHNSYTKCARCMERIIHETRYSRNVKNCPLHVSHLARKTLQSADPNESQFVITEVVDCLLKGLTFELQIQY